jgi:hypothetical protein
MCVDSEIEARLAKLEEEIAKVKSRNERVERDKAWETSWFRMLVITAATYVLAALVFWLIGVEHFLLNAVVPTLAYVISSQSLPLVKKWWLARKTGAH